MSGRIDITGRRFGRLVVTGHDHRDREEKKSYWQCLCDCGKKSIVRGCSLKNGDTTSCGCLRAENLRKGRLAGMQASSTRTTAQGYVGTPSYKIWRGMLCRCFTPSSGNYNRYGGRGITVCERWLDFSNFLSDMGPRPPRTSIDRINVNGNYEPGNCRWVTAKEQTANRRPLLEEHVQRSLANLARGRKIRRRKIGLEP